VSLNSLLKKLRLIDPVEPDVVIAIRLRATEDGSWDLKWDGCHWLIFDKGFEPRPDQLPPGVAERIVKAFAYETAKSTGGDFFATMGASFGKAAVDKVSELLPHIRRK
jgi:hypothetical protein